MKIKSQRDFVSGVMFVALGIAFAWGAANYPIGAAAQMGPGYFPLVLGVVLAALGMFIVFGSLVVETEDGEPMGAWAWRPLGFIIAANVAFGVLVGGLPAIGVPPLGLIAAVVVLTFVAALAGRGFVLREVAVLALVLAFASGVALVLLLQLQVPLWPWFVG
ncbi:MAG TPA: tripartite tricarboxylate transporter TctB family protein [Ramlibacter sp.]